jgi:N-acetylglucosamine-6-sulfatase
VEYPDDSTHVPPGWDEWHVQYGGFGQYFNYSLNENGTVVRYGGAPSDYSADVLTGKVVDFIERAEAEDAQPFFVFFAPSAPHGDGVPNGRATPAPRHKGMFQGVAAPRPPSFNEADVSDKPAPIRDLPPLTAQQIAGIDIEYQTRLEALQAVDEGIEKIVNTLAGHGELENTYIFFTSDNGYHLGQHRFLNGKFQVYEEDIRVPLVVRGPGVRQGATRDQFVLNIDFAPTIAALAGIQPGHSVDGRSLVPLLGRQRRRGHGSRKDDWRQDFLVEIYRRSPPLGNGDAIRALRTRDAVYVEYASGPRELYDLRADPYQLESLHDAARPRQLGKLSRRLEELAACAGDTCRR